MKRGLTVWEWVGIVFSVLVIAVLLPVVGRPRNPYERVSCLSQEKQLGLSLIQYAIDYDELMPPPTHDAKNTWRGAVYSYVKSMGIYKCPQDDRPVGPDGYFQSYAFNANSIINKWGAKAQSPLTAPEYERIVLLCEIQNTDYAALSIDDPLRFGPDKHILAVRHSDGGDYLFSDGHAKWFRPSAFTVAKPVVRWYRDPKRTLSANAQIVLKAAAP